MRLAFHFVNPDTGYWRLEEEKTVQGGSVDALLYFTRDLPISCLRLYCQPSNALAYLSLCSKYETGINTEVLAPVCAPVDPVMRLKSLFASHYSSLVLNPVCRPLREDAIAWYMAVPTVATSDLVESLPLHTAYPLASFPLRYSPGMTARLLGHILSPYRFLDRNDQNNNWSRLLQSLQINDRTAERFVNGDRLDDHTVWAYASWNPGYVPSDDELATPCAFLHRIANVASGGVATATRLWVRMLATYWSDCECDATLSKEPGGFLKKQGEREALRRHLESIVA